MINRLNDGHGNSDGYADLFPDYIDALRTIKDVVNDCLNALDSDSAYNSVRVVKIIKAFDENFSMAFNDYGNIVDNILNEYYISHVDN